MELLLLEQKARGIIKKHFEYKPELELKIRVNEDSIKETINKELKKAKYLLIEGMSIYGLIAGQANIINVNNAITNELSYFNVYNNSRRKAERKNLYEIVITKQGINNVIENDFSFIALLMHETFHIGCAKNKGRFNFSISKLGTDQNINELKEKEIAIIVYEEILALCAEKIVLNLLNVVPRKHYAEVIEKIKHKLNEFEKMVGEKYASQA